MCRDLTGTTGKRWEPEEGNLGQKETTENGLRIVDISDPSTQDFEAAMAIYASSFPDGERVTADELRAGMLELAQSAYHHFWVVKSEDAVVGLAVFEYLAEHNLGYLGYIAVDAGQRGNGTGAWLFNRVRCQIVRDARDNGHTSPVGLCAEVERVEDATTEAERTMRARRIAFYCRLGGASLPIAYLVPPLKPDGAELRFNLLFFQTDVSVDFPDICQAQEIGLAVLEDVYGVGRDSKYGRFLQQEP